MTPPGDSGARRARAKQAWLSFLKTRAPFEGPTSSSDAQELDDELAVLGEVVAVARRQRNARVAWPCRLPVEVLAMILLEVKIIWSPEMTRMTERDLEEDEEFRAFDPSKWCSHQTRKRGPGVLGWLNATYVCSALREVALALPSLWCDIECSELHPNFRDIVEARSANQPLRYDLDFDGDTLKRSIDFTQMWLTPSACSHLRSLRLGDIHKESLQEIIGSIPYLPELKEFSLGLWNYAEELLVDVKLPLASPHQLSRLSFQDCMPPLSSPMFSSEITHLSFSWTSTSRAPVVLVDDILDMICSLPQLEQLRLSCTPASDDTAISDAPTSATRRRLLPPTFRRLECVLGDENDGVHSAFEILTRIKFSRGVEVVLLDSNEYDYYYTWGDEGTQIASRLVRLANMACCVNCDLHRSCWGLLLTVAEAYILLGDDVSWSTEHLRSPDDTRSWTTDRADSSLIRIGRNACYNDKVTAGDLDGLAQLLPLETLAYFTLSGTIIRRLSEKHQEDRIQIVEKLLSAPGIRHLAIAIIAQAATLLEKLVRTVHKHDDCASIPLPSLESIHLYVDAKVDDFDDPGTKDALAPVFSALVAAVNSRQHCNKAVREIRVDRKVWAMYSWEEGLHGTSVVVV
ncbi:unnamed protein product [Peniophora sp. CBMAI 1063]|nr:unnamed protein product [Peniophora sp. CBMAI 1063]